MKESTQRGLLWTFTVGCILCGSAWSLVPLPGAADRLARVPLEADGYVGREAPLNERELKVLGRVDHLHREYAVAGRSLYVTLIDGSRDRHAVHDPRYCFRGAGWNVVEEESREIPGGKARWLRAERDGETAEAAYWFSDGSRRHGSLQAYLATTVIRRISFGRYGGQPVLVVVQSFSAEPMDWKEMQRMVETLRL